MRIQTRPGYGRKWQWFKGWLFAGFGGQIFWLHLSFGPLTITFAKRGHTC